jgi:PAS domain S-box-containing protein
MRPLDAGGGKGPPNPVERSVPDGGDSVSEGPPDYSRVVTSVANYAIFMLEPDGTIDSWTDAAREVYGYDGDEVLGEHIRTLSADESDAPVDIEAVLDEGRDGAVETEQWHERDDGSVFWATCSISPVVNDVFHGYAVVIRDTTAQKQYVRMLERQNDRLKEFTDILSHDLRNPLAVLNGRLTLYRETGDEMHLEEIDNTTDRMERLIDDLLRVARQGNVVEHPQPTDIGSIVFRAREATLPAPAQLEYERVPTVIAASDRLLELFENLLRNAREHAGKAVTVRVGPYKDGFYVEDDGPGITDENKPRVFDHGFTTRDDGTGFGLSVVRTIVGAHGWDVSATDSTTGGARFEVTGIEFVDDEP